MDNFQIVDFSSINDISYFKSRLRKETGLFQNEELHKNACNKVEALFHYKNKDQIIALLNGDNLCGLLQYFCWPSKEECSEFHIIFFHVLENLYKEQMIHSLIDEVVNRARIINARYLISQYETEPVPSYEKGFRNKQFHIIKRYFMSINANEINKIAFEKSINSKKEELKKENLIYRLWDGLYSQKIAELLYCCYRNSHEDKLMGSSIADYEQRLKNNIQDKYYSPGCCYLIYKGDVVVAGGLGGLLFAENGCIYDIVVLPEIQNKGLGTFLSQMVLLSLCNEKFKKICLHVSVDNKAALKIYSKLGFHIEEYNNLVVLKLKP